jgi:hypothetical protein
MSKKKEYNENEIVWALDKCQMYPAKVLKCKLIGSCYKYFIHYQGWAAKYDTWHEGATLAHKGNADDEDRLRKLCIIEPNAKKKKTPSAKKEDGDNDNNVEELKGEFDDKELKTKKKKESSEIELNILKKNKKLAQQDLIEDVDSSLYKIQFNIPMQLKRFMVDEWKLITATPGKLMNLPKPKRRTVQAFFDDFLQYREAKLSPEHVSYLLCP